jgi:hypothetical protein
VSPPLPLVVRLSSAVAWRRPRDCTIGLRAGHRDLADIGQGLEHLRNQCRCSPGRRLRSSAAVRPHPERTSRVPPTVFDMKVQAIYNHFLTAYGDDGSSVYTVRALPAGSIVGIVNGEPLDLDRVSDAVVERIRTDPQFAARGPRPRQDRVLRRATTPDRHHEL